MWFSVDILTKEPFIHYYLITDDLYMSPVETWCHNLNYYIPDDTRETKDFSKENMTRIRKYFLKHTIQGRVAISFPFIFYSTVGHTEVPIRSVICNLISFNPSPPVPAALDSSVVAAGSSIILLNFLTLPFFRHGKIDHCLVYFMLCHDVYCFHYWSHWMLENWT